MCRLRDCKSVGRETYTILNGANDVLNTLQEYYAFLTTPF